MPQRFRQYRRRVGACRTIASSKIASFYRESGYSHNRRSDSEPLESEAETNVTPPNQSLHRQPKPTTLIANSGKKASGTNVPRYTVGGVSL